MVRVDDMHRPRLSKRRAGREKHRIGHRAAHEIGVGPHEHVIAQGQGIVVHAPQDGIFPNDAVG